MVMAACQTGNILHDLFGRTLALHVKPTGTDAA